MGKSKGKGTKDKTSTQPHAIIPEYSLAGVPHILRAIIHYANLPRSQLVEIRRVSRLVCSVVDEQLCKHVAISIKSNNAYLFTPDGKRIPGLRFEKGNTRAVKERCKALLGYTRIVDHSEGNVTLLKASLAPHTVRRYKPGSSLSIATVLMPSQLGQSIQIDFQELFDPERVTPGGGWPYHPGARVCLTERSVREWILNFRFHRCQPRLSQTYFEVDWQANGPQAVTVILSTLEVILQDTLKIPFEHGSTRRLGILHDLVLLMATNQHIKWTFVVDMANLPDGALGCHIPDASGTMWLREAVGLMASEIRKATEVKFHVYTLEEYRNEVGEETFGLHTRYYE